jgi:hypothetical protein
MLGRFTRNVGTPVERSTSERTNVDTEYHVQERNETGVWCLVRSASDIDTAAERAAEHIAKRPIPYPIRLVKIVTTTTTTVEVSPL